MRKVRMWRIRDREPRDTEKERQRERNGIDGTSQRLQWMNEWVKPSIIMLWLSLVSCSYTYAHLTAHNLLCCDWLKCNRVFSFPYSIQTSSNFLSLFPVLSMCVSILQQHKVPQNRLHEHRASKKKESVRGHLKKTF